MSETQGEKLPWNVPQFAKIYRGAEKFTGPFALALLEQAEFQSAAKNGGKLVVLDNGCGTGIVAEKIMNVLDDEAKTRLDLTCADLADAMVDGLAERMQGWGWTQARSVKADAQDTKLPSDHYSHIFFNFGPFLLPDPLASVRECRRMLQPGAVFGFTTWNRVPWIRDVREALAQKPEFPKIPEDSVVMGIFSSSSERWDNVADVRSHFEGAGFVNVKVETAENTSRIDTIEEFTDMLPYSLGMMIPKFWTQEEVEQYKKPAEAAAVDYVKKKYGDGPIVWNWVAIVATGYKPE